jgi:hypothetical protein
MNVKKLLVTTVVLGIVLNVLDAVAHGMILRDRYLALPGLFRQDAHLYWFVIGDFVAALVVVWVYDRVYGSFGGGPKGGATFGFYMGVLVSFPTWLFMRLLFVGFPYSLAWIWTIWGIVLGVVAGAVTGALYKK